MADPLTRSSPLRSFRGRLTCRDAYGATQAGEGKQVQRFRHGAPAVVVVFGGIEPHFGSGRNAQSEGGFAGEERAARTREPRDARRIERKRVHVSQVDEVRYGRRETRLFMDFA